MNTIHRVTKKFIHQVFEESDLVVTAYKLYDETDQNQPLQLAALKFLQHLTRNSGKYAHVLIQQGAARRLCHSLCTTSKPVEMLSRILETVWNLSCHSQEKKAILEWTIQVGEEQCLIRLRETFIYFLLQTHSRISRSLRNDVMTIVAILVRNAVNYDQCDAIFLVQSGWIRLIIQLLTFEKETNLNPIFKNLKLIPNPENLDLKKMAISTIVQLARRPEVIKLVSEMRLMSTLLEYACPVEHGNNVDHPKILLGKAEHYEHCNNEVSKNISLMSKTENTSCEPKQTSAITQWPTNYFVEVQLLSLEALSVLGPILKENVCSDDVPARLTNYLRCLCASGDHMQYKEVCLGNVKDQPYKRAQMKHGIRCVRSLISTNDFQIKKSFKSYDLLQFLVELLPTVRYECNPSLPHTEVVFKGAFSFGKRPSTQAIGSDEQMEHIEDNAGIEMQQDILYTLAWLCKDDDESKELFSTTGVDQLISVLSVLPGRLAQFEEEPILNRSQVNEETDVGKVRCVASKPSYIKLAHALIDAVWCCVVGRTNYEDYFIYHEGVTKMIDLLEWYPRYLANQLVGCLVDLSENPKCLPQLIQWTGCRPVPMSDQNNGGRTVLESVSKLIANIPDSTACFRLNRVAAHMALRNRIEGTQQTENDQINNEIATLTQGPNIVELMCDLWNWEELERIELINEKRCQEQLTESSTEPNGEIKPQCSSPSAPVPLSLNSKPDDLRLALYGLFLRLGIENIEEYGASAQFSLQKIKRYLDCKTREVWSQIEKELDQDHIQPVTPDAEMLKNIRLWGHKQAEDLHIKYEEIQRRADALTSTKEQAFYTKILEIQRDLHQAAEYRRSFVERTSDIEMLRQAKSTQLALIADSRVRRSNEIAYYCSDSSYTESSESANDSVLETESGTDNGNPRSPNCLTQEQYENENALPVSTYHATDIPGSNVTAFCCETVHVDSTPECYFQNHTKLEREILSVIK